LAIIGSLSTCGDDVTEAERLLEDFERAQERRFEMIDRLLDALDKIPLDVG
jgi:hypothetical protein